MTMNVVLFCGLFAVAAYAGYELGRGLERAKKEYARRGLTARWLDQHGIIVMLGAQPAQPCGVLWVRISTASLKAVAHGWSPSEEYALREAELPAKNETPNNVIQFPRYQ